MQAKLAEREQKDNPDGARGTSSVAAATASGAKKKKRKSKKKRKTKWHVGSQCRCVFSEDGYLYDAEIISIDYENEKCQVRYKIYGNEEEQDLADLLPLTHKVRKQKNMSQSETDSMEWTGQSPGPSRAAQRPDSGAANQGADWSGFGQFPSAQPYQSMPPPPSAMPPFPGFGSQASTSRGPPMPPPPPPPPPIMEDFAEDDSEALSSMLIAWYMSGYHTGYYQGLKQGRQQSAGGAAMMYGPR